MQRYKNSVKYEPCFTKMSEIRGLYFALRSYRLVILQPETRTCPESCEIANSKSGSQDKATRQLRRVALCAKKVFGDTCRLA